MESKLQAWRRIQEQKEKYMAKRECNKTNLKEPRQWTARKREPRVAVQFVSVGNQSKTRRLAKRETKNQKM
jgi:ABC-type tungstate transport system permease subunit